MRIAQGFLVVTCRHHFLNNCRVLVVVILKTMSQQQPVNKKANRLINESSPYLLQHAYNPVDWHPWNTETLNKAKAENKMLLISVGYSACHWCHVMERESFEDENIAQVMNRDFICIKVDREERPDVDAIYMNAVQLIHGNGGWPLNCFALPDGRPFYGGTYFQPGQWLDVLNKIVTLYKNQKADLEQQAKRLLGGIESDTLVKPDLKTDRFTFDTLDQAVTQWSYSFDNENGGYRGAPKFPMPNNFLSLMRYNFFARDEKLSNYLTLTLDKMAAGGIYDQIGGGFARYSVDSIWKAPHFEKMLYDNAQLISLYTESYLMGNDRRHLQVAIETADFVLRELTSPEGLFFAALDADSEGEEGKFYVWKKHEIEEVLGEEAAVISDFFGVNGQGFWEEGKNILLKTEDEKSFAKRKGIDPQAFSDLLTSAKSKLLNAREQRVRPGLDDKCLTSWNSLMISALCHLYIASGNPDYKSSALKAGNTIIEKMIKPDGSIMRNYKNGKATISGFLEDYSFTIEALTDLYQITGNESFIKSADRLARYALSNFWDDDDGLFWFTDSASHDLVARKKEVTDNVIPASNSSMGVALFKLSKLLYNNDYLDIVRRMTGMMQANIKQYPTSFSNWAMLWMYLSRDFYEIAVTGDGADAKVIELLKFYYPCKIVAGTDRPGELPLFHERWQSGKTMIYVCADHVCKNPVQSVEEALDQIVIG
jgi:uncharacterized protein